MDKSGMEDIPNCWEIEDCPEEVRNSCRAWPDMGRQCWKITGTMCDHGFHKMSALEEKILYCRNHCTYYRQYIKAIYR